MIFSDLFYILVFFPTQTYCRPIVSLIDLFVLFVLRNLNNFFY